MWGLLGLVRCVSGCCETLQVVNMQIGLREKFLYSHWTWQRSLSYSKVCLNLDKIAICSFLRISLAVTQSNYQMHKFGGFPNTRSSALNQETAYKWSFHEANWTNDMLNDKLIRTRICKSWHFWVWHFWLVNVQFVCLMWQKKTLKGSDHISNYLQQTKLVRAVLRLKAELKLTEQN